MAVRDICLEYDTGPFGDDYIMRKIQFATNYIYNHFVKSNDSLFFRHTYVNIEAFKQEYDLPKNLFGKRIEILECPNPPQSGSVTPYAWVEIAKKDISFLSRYDAPNVQTLIPSAWGQRDNKFIIVPPPMVSYKARFACAIRLPKMARDEGIITSFVGNKIVLDDAASADMHNALAQEGKNILTICDGQTGRVKKVYPFVDINGNEITLGSSTRTTISSFPVTSVREANAYSVSYDPVTGVCTLTSDQDISGISVGDYIEIVYQLTPGKGYNVIDSLTDDSNFYQPADFVAPSNPFPRLATVLSVSGPSLTFKLDSFQAPVVDGILNPPGAVASGNVLGAALGVYSGQAVISVTLDSDPSLEAGIAYRMRFVGTGITELDTAVVKCYRINATTVAVLASTVTGVFAGGTWALEPFAGAPTGIPALTEIALTTPSALVVSVYKNSPYSYQLYPSKSTIDPDVYDPTDNIEIDDVVSVGYSCGAFPLIDAYEEICVLYAALPMRSSANESDSVAAALLKQLIEEMKGDTAGRMTGVHISRDFSRRAFFTRASYRSRR